MPKQVTIKFTSGSITIDLLDGFVTENGMMLAFLTLLTTHLHFPRIGL